MTPYILFNQSPQQLRRIGARGGKARARNMASPPAGPASGAAPARSPDCSPGVHGGSSHCPARYAVPVAPGRRKTHRSQARPSKTTERRPESPALPVAA